MRKWTILMAAVALFGGVLAEEDWYYDTSGRTVTAPASENVALLDLGSTFGTYESTIRASVPDVTDIFDSVWYSWAVSLGIDRFSSEKLGMILLFR